MVADKRYDPVGRGAGWRACCRSSTGPRTVHPNANRCSAASLAESQSLAGTAVFAFACATGAAALSVIAIGMALGLAMPMHAYAAYAMRFHAY